jgi:hypothetical protein
MVNLMLEIMSLLERQMVNSIERVLHRIYVR